MPDRSIVDTWERLVRYHRTTTAAMDRHLQTRFGHSLDDYDVLHQISVHGEPIRMGDLASNLLVANSSCNRIVGRLVDGGFVERSYGESDGRVVLVDLTPAGKTLRRRMAAVHTRDIQARFGTPMSPAEAAEIDKILQHLLTQAPTDPS
ncbi:MAG: DNA-binding MarR family transcriptional regulator [Acidimicrobiales bacterium]|jgi:DNA-binding MarR family transcriptional regulator